MIQHAILTPQDGIHQPHSYSYADTTARLAASGFVASDIGKLAIQINDKSVWLLANYSPITWNALGQSDAQSIQGRAVINTAPTNGQALVWNQANTRWEPGTITSGISSIFGRTTSTITAESGDYSSFYSLTGHDHNAIYATIASLSGYATTTALTNHNHTGTYATLTGGKLTIGELPAVAISDTTVCDSEVLMLALTAEIGDVCVRSDLNKTFILKTSPATVLANWVELLSPTGNTYTPSTPADWDGPPPTTISEALNRLAYYLSFHMGNPIP